MDVRFACSFHLLVYRKLFYSSMTLELKAGSPTHLNQYGALWPRDQGCDVIVKEFWVGIG